MRRTLAFLLALSLLGVPPVAANHEKTKKNSDIQDIGQRDINKGSWNIYSAERELALGEELARQSEHNSKLLNDPVVTAYVTEVADRVARHSDLKMPLQVRVIDSNEVNAFALPGGHFFINTGLLLETQNEAELAAVVAHEIAHVAARHATKQMTKAQMLNLMTLPLLFVGGPVAYGVQQGLSLAVPLTFLKFSRNNEREADFLGQEYQYASGYDPSAFISFFERVGRAEKSHKSGIARAFSTHPMTKDRIAAAERNIEEVLPPQGEYVITTSRHDEVRAYLLGLQGRLRTGGTGDGPVLRRRSSEEAPVGKGPTPHPNRLPY